MDASAEMDADLAFVNYLTDWETWTTIHPAKRTIVYLITLVRGRMSNG